MPTVAIGNATYALRPYVEEAVAHFGFVRPEALDWLTRELAAGFHRNMGRTVREGGTRLDPATRAAMGLPRYGDGHLSAEVWEALTEEGRRDPVVHFDATCWRAAKRLRSVAQYEQQGRVAGIFVGVTFHSLGTMYEPCAAGRELHGRMVAEPPPILPLPGCDKLQCPCNWRGVTKFELARQRG